MIVGVIGSGSIGPDLAYGFLGALVRTPGAKVFLCDIKQEALDAGVARIKGYLDKGVARGKLAPAAAQATLAALVPTLSLADLAPCSYVLEAASEDLPVKRKILAQLEAVVGPDCLIGFATSGIPRKLIAAEARHPARCFVNHPFFPAWRSLPVEVVSSGDPARMAAMMSTLRVLGKVPLPTADVPCFAADDIFCNYISEAARIVAEGVATPAQVDRIVDDAVGGGGPFNVMDGTRGNLLTVHCQELMQEGYGNAWFAPPAILRERGTSPWHDRKAPGSARYDDALRAVVLDRMLAVLLGRTLAVVDEGTCAPDDLDWMTRMALGFRTGLVSLAHELGAERVRALCDGYRQARPDFPVPPSVRAGAMPAFRRFVKSERVDGAGGTVAVVRVFRPEVKNALSRRTLEELDAAVAEAVAEPAVRGVVISSWDGALAGADIGELAALPTPEACRDICLASHPIFARLEAARVPVVAAVDGPVMGGGAELSMACHARVVGPDLVMSQPEVNLGIIPGYGGTQRLARLVGLARAAELVRTARSVNAAEACAMGWAHGQPVADPVAAAIALIGDHHAGRVRLAPVDPAALAVPERLPHVALGHRSRAIDAILCDVLRRGLALPLAEGLAVEADGFGRCRATVDMDVGMKNFTQNGPRVPAAFLHE
jgi:enoyl-CoA hydratase/3-hydroxyacyl-CoA dehydrogenase